MGTSESKPAGEESNPDAESSKPDAFADTDTDTSGSTTENPFFIADGRSSPDPFTTRHAPREPASPESPVAALEIDRTPVRPAARSSQVTADMSSAKRMSLDARLKAVATARRAMNMTEACRRKRLIKGFPELDPTPTKPETLASFTASRLHFPGAHLHFPGGCIPGGPRSRSTPPNTPGPGGWQHGDDALPSCAFRAGVTEEERAELRIIARRFPSELDGVPHTSRAYEGYLELGWARCWVELQPAYDRSSTPDEVRAAEHERLLRGLSEAQAWRRQAGAEAFLENGLPPDLMDGVQIESWEYGKTTAGLPIFVDRAVTWLSAIRAARQQGLSPQQWGEQRVYWHERCLDVVAQRHAAGEGNGQYIHIVDFEGVDVGLTELLKSWPYIKEAAITVALHYGGCCARMYAARPLRVVNLIWKLLRPFLADVTSAKVAVVSPCSAAPRIEHYNYSPLTAMTPESLPTFLGGSLEEPRGPLHFCPAPLSMSTI